MKKQYLTIFFLLMVGFAYSQCNLNPTIEEDSEIILCPNGASTLNTQEYDAYQWYRRFFTSSTAEPILNAITAFYTVNPVDDAAYFFSVEVTQDTCTAITPEVFVDAWAFLPVTVANSGDYIFDGENFIVCEGDTMFFDLQLPYSKNITWTRNGTPIPGETNTTLVVTSPGVYHVMAAPEECPDYIQGLGVSLPVVVEDCDPTSVEETNPIVDINLYPNPASDYIMLENKTGIPLAEIKIIDSKGNLVLYKKAPGFNNTHLTIQNLPNGMYFLITKHNTKINTQKFIINH